MADSDKFELPRDGEHIAIWGMTGSGKTQLGAWLLSKKPLRKKPVVIIDYKRDKLLDSLERSREISTHDVPEKPGLYILHAIPKVDDEKIEQWLWDIWAKEDTDIYVDEGYMLPQGDAFDAVLTQGRSKSIGVTTLSQRPVHVSRFVPSEASHVVMFRLNDDRDVDTVKGIVPRDFPYWVPPQFADGKLPAFHARWYSVKRDKRFVLAPVPDAETIRDSIDSQLEPKLRWL